MKLSRALLAVALTVVALLSVAPPSLAQDVPIARRQPITCPVGQYVYYSPTATVWYCTTTQPAMLNGSAITATATELNKLAGVTATATELNYTDVTAAGTTQASKALVTDANGAMSILRTASLRLGTSGSETTVTATGAEVNYNAGVTPGTVTASKTVMVGANKNVDTLAVATQVNGASATEGAATQVVSKVIKKTGIADNTATDVITVTVPNANAAASIRLIILSSNGSTDAFESSRTATGNVVLARTAGANVVATAVALAGAGIATVASGATHTLAYDLGSVSGAVGATNTFTIRVTIDDSGNTGSNQVVVFAELLNAETGGVTIAAS